MNCLEQKSMTKHLMETPETQSVEDDSIEAAESDGTNEGEELQDRISLKNSKLYYLESRK